jgi:hypothetical protein
MKTTGKVLIAIGVIAAILLIINMGLLKDNGSAPIFNVAPTTYEYPTDIPCSTTQDCINYAKDNGATNTDSRCDKTCIYIVTEPIDNVVKGGAPQ